MTPEDIANRALERQARAAAQEASDINAVLSLDHGRRVLWRLLARCGVFEVSFRGDGAEWTAHREGRRSIGLEMLAEIEARRPGCFAVMGREAAAAIEEERRAAAEDAADLARINASA